MSRPARGGRDRRHRGAARRARRALADATAAPRAPRALAALAITLGVVAIMRAGLAFPSTMTWWGLNTLRFTPPAAGWTLWLLAAIALVPAVGGRALPALDALGDAIARLPARAAIVAGALTAGLVFALPDEAWLTGDFIMRLGSALGDVPTEAVFPQALPMDLFLHHTLLAWAQSALRVNALAASRALGALEAGLLAACAVGFARVLDQRRAAALVVVAAIAWNGALGLFTGYAKAFSELCVLAVAIAALGVRLARTGRGAWPLAIAVSLGILAHRSALAFLVPFAVAAALWVRDPALPRRPLDLAALALPFVTIGAALPRIISAIESTDRLHLARQGASPGAVLGAAFAPGHLREAANVMLWLAPLALALLPLVLALGRSLWRRREGLVLAALLAPFVLLVLLVHPRQGMFRDWDVFAAGGVATCVVVAWLAGEALRGSARGAWVAAAVLLAAFGPALGPLLIANQPDRAFARVAAYLDEPPARPGEERALLFDFLGSRTMALGRTDASAEWYRRAVELAPSQRLLYQYGMSQVDRGDLRGAQQSFRRITQIAPDMIQAWGALANASFQLGDTAEARRAAMAVLRMRPGHVPASAMMRNLAAADSMAKAGRRP